VNFYTLTFKKKILLSFFFILLLLIILDVFLIYIANQKTTKNKFINDKFSKIKHFELNESLKKDIVFVGSSRTFYHVSTNKFLENDINIYNFGVSGAQFEDYPTLIDALLLDTPKKVIINLSINRLYDDLEISKFPTFKELSYYYHIDKIMFLNALGTYIINFHTLLQYSEPIYNKFTSFYKKFDFYSNMNVKEIQQRDSNNYSYLVGCNVFDIKKVLNQVTLKCTNGDGILLGSNISYDKIKKQETVLNALNLKSVKYLTNIINSLDKQGIEVILLFEPILDNKYRYDLNVIQNSFPNTRIVDLTNYRINDNDWFDNNHLNYKGREQYSDYLVSLYKKGVL
jgi:hypothetical protein